MKSTKKELYESIMKSVSKAVKKHLNEWGEYGDHRGIYGKDFEDDDEWERLCDMCRDLCNDWENYFKSLPKKVQKNILTQMTEEDDYELVDEYFYPFADKWILKHRDKYDLPWIENSSDLETPMGEREISPLDGNQYTSILF